MNLVFHPDARAEYLDAATFYESRRPGLGAAFTREVESAIERIADSPERWRAIEQDHVLIVAVAHASRKPGYWRSRLGG